MFLFESVLDIPIRTCYTKKLIKSLYCSII
nr:MAG TPA: hypothetical protein [Caudoviricetes sp.]